MASPRQYVSEKTANALVSDLGPTSLSAECLDYINLILDEILATIIEKAESIDPLDIKLKGVPAVFAAESSITPIVSHFGSITKQHARSTSSSGDAPASKLMMNPLKTSSFSHEAGSKSLARDAVNEAELELAAWRTADQKAKRKDAFKQDERGLRPGLGHLPFPAREAIQFLRSRVAAYSSLASHKPDPAEDKRFLQAWTAAGGSTAPDVLAPASLYMTAIIEHVCERILAELGRVAMRNASSGTVTQRDLYVCMCEGDVLWGLFKQLEVKEALEASVPSTLAADQVLNRPRGNEQRNPTKPAPTHRRIASSSSYSAGIVADTSRSPPPDLPPTSSRQSQTSVSRPSSVHSPGLNRQTSRSSMATFGSGDIQGPNSPGNRSGRQSVDTFRDNSISLQRGELRSAKEEEFDALLTSGHTMKVSLTPSRLKRFDRSRVNSSPPAGVGSLSNKVTPNNSPLGRHSSTFARSDNNKLRKSSISSGLPTSASLPITKMLPRDIDESNGDAEEEQPPLDPTSPRKSSLAEILRSDPPWGEQAKGASHAPVRMRSASTSPTGPSRMPVLGRPIAPSLARPADPVLERNLLSTKPARSQEERTEEPARPATENSTVHRADEKDMPAAAPRKRSSAADLADFFRNTAPPPSEAKPSSPISTPPRKKSETTDLADFFKNTAPPVVNQPSPKSKPGRIRSMLARVISKDSEDPKQTMDSRTTLMRTNRMGSSDDTADKDTTTRDTLERPSPSDRTGSQSDLSPAPVAADGRVRDGNPLDANSGSPPRTPALGPTMPIVPLAGARPKTLAKHQILVFDPAEQSTTSSEISLVGHLRAILSPYYTVGLITKRSLRKDPWEATCALLVVVSDDVSQISPDPLLRERISNFLQSEGKIWAVGEVAGMFCTQHEISERKFLPNALLLSASVRAGINQDAQSESEERAKSMQRSAFSIDLDTATARSIEVLRRFDAKEAIVAIGSSCSTGQVVLWTFDFCQNSGAANQNQICESALDYLNIRALSPVTPATTKSHWADVDVKLLQPKRPLPVILLSHPSLDNRLPSKIFKMPELDANASSRLIGQENSSLAIKIIKDSENVFQIHDLATNHLDVPAFIAEARAQEVVEPETTVSPAIPVILAARGDKSVGWQRDWTPLFDFGSYWEELDRISSEQGVVRKREAGSTSEDLGTWGIGDLVQYGEAVGSTQTMLDKNPILLYGLPVPFVSLASFQLAGRGRGRNQWLSPAGCLQFSILLKLPRGFPANKVVFAQYIAGLAICQGLDEDGKLGVRIKWPNDIYAEAEGLGQSGSAQNGNGVLDSESAATRAKGRAKLGGILVNSSYVKGEWHLVVGCGVNILNDLPTTSLAQLYELAHQRRGHVGPAPVPSMESSFAKILVAFEEIWQRFVQERSFEGFLDEYTGRWLHTDQRVTLTTVTPHMPLIIKTLELNSGLLRCVKAKDDGDSWGRSYDGYEDRYSTPSAAAASQYVDLQPDGNSFDLMSGLIKQKT